MSKKKTESKQKKERNATKTAIYDRKTKIARDRGIDTDELLKYDLVHSPYLYDMRDDLPAKEKKCQLLFEGSLSSVDYTCFWNSAIDTMIDLMANLRRVPVRNISTFLHFFEDHYDFLSSFLNLGRCDFVYDIYSDEPSVQD